MTKQVVLTSAFWSVALVAVLVFFAHGSHKPHPQPAEQRPEVLAYGSASEAGSGDRTRISAAQAPDARLAPVQLSAEGGRMIGVETGTAEYKRVNNSIRATGTVAVDERRLSYVQLRFSGYVRKVFADAPYQHVHKGEALFTIYSPELLATEREYLLARQNEAALERSSVEGVAEGAATLAHAAEERLSEMGVPAGEIAKLMETGKAVNDLTISSQVTGYITERNAVPELFVQPSTRLYTVADLSRVWVNAEVFQDDVSAVKPGAPATISVDAYPGSTFHAKVEQILPQVDTATRTVPVRLAVENPGIRLKPGMYVNVELQSVGGERLVIPASAVFETGTRQLVFVDDGHGTFTPTEVVLGPGDGSERVVLSGLSAHQRIATSANFLLDSESQLQAAAAPAQAGSESASADQAAQGTAAVSIAFSTDPNPPHKGANVFRVKLTGADGKPVTDAAVSVTFFMAAMPAMGMAAMKTTSSLQSRGDGVYEGSGALGSGGSWQVTITAQRSGRMLATREMRVNAEGGM